MTKAGSELTGLLGSLPAGLMAEALLRRQKLLDKIFSNCTEVDYGGEYGPCWEWQGSHSGEGRGGQYGRFSFEGKTASVHRTIWATIFGPIPPRKQIDHKCCNRICCNPSHLQLTAHKKNQKLKVLRSKP